MADMSREDQMAELLERWEAAAAQGRPLMPEELCRNCPEMLADFQQLLAKLGAITAVLQGCQVAASPQDLVGRIDAGRYRPISYYDQGGNGMVFLAEDSELNRTVALKWMQALPALDPELQKRFLLEAEITAKLDHPGIVPIFGKGRDGGGRPFYAMRFIHGEHLGDVAKRFHAEQAVDETARNVEFRRLLQGFVAVCKTMAYAHARGVIHRDLKPGNVMLGPFGETLVLDWGLAKTLNSPNQNGDGAPMMEQLLHGSDNGAGLTASGKVEGSPAYMAPEQACGHSKRIGPQTDVYGLGATMYVLLTGQKPFSGKSSIDVVEQVKVGRFAPPRQINPSVARPLEAICLKAMAYHPEDRYPSANELAADLEHWLADEPTTAWREPMLVRARRWVKRHRTLVAASLAALLIGAVCLATLGTWLIKTNHQLDTANNDLKKSNSDLIDSKNSLKLSLDASQKDFEEANLALADLFGNLSKRNLGAAGLLGIQVWKDSLHKYSGYYKRFAERNADWPEKRPEVAYALLMCGQIAAMLGDDPAEALDFLKRSAAQYDQLANEKPGDRESAFGRARTEVIRGQILSERGRLEEALPLLKSARLEFARLAQDSAPIHLANIGPSGIEDVFQDSPAVQLASATQLAVEAALLDDRLKRMLHGKAAAPVTALSSPYREWVREAHDVLTGGRQLPPDAPAFTELLDLQLELALVSGAADRAETRRRLNEVAARSMDLLSRFPNFVEVSIVEIEARSRLARLAKEEGRTEEAKTQWAKIREAAVKTEQSVREVDPFGIRSGILVVMFESSWELIWLDTDSKVKTHFDEALAALDQFIAVKHRTPTETARVVNLLLRRARAAGPQLEAQAEGELWFQRSAQLLEAQMRETPDQTEFDSLLVICHVGEGVARVRRRGKSGGDSFAKAETVLEKMTGPGHGAIDVDFCRALLLNGRALEKQLIDNDFAGALVLYEQALNQIAAAEKRGLPVEDVAVVRCTTELALALLLGGRADELLKASPNGSPEALQLVNRALDLLKPQKISPSASQPERDAYEALEPLRQKAIGFLQVMQKQAAGMK